MSQILLFCIYIVYSFAEDCTSCSQKGFSCYDAARSDPCFNPRAEKSQDPEAVCLFFGAKYCPEFILEFELVGDKNCPSGHYIATDNRVSDDWCEQNCHVDPNWCTSTGLCKCADPVPTPSPTLPKPSHSPTTSEPTMKPTTSKPTQPTTRTPTYPGSKDPVNLCYFTNWARYRHGYMNNGNDAFENNLDPTLCTHINYGFGTIDKHTFALKSFDPNADLPSGASSQTKPCPEKCKPGYIHHDWSKPNPCEWPCSPDRKFRGYEGLNFAMKRKNPKLKSILSVGGWNFNDCSFDQLPGQGKDSCEIFSTIAGSEENTRTHANHVIDFLRTWRFDGYDIDWEYPVVAGHNSLDGKATPQDYNNYVRFLHILREQFEKEAKTSGLPRLLLTAAVGVGIQNVQVAYNIPAMSLSLDFISMMTYDLHGAWDDVTGFNAPLYATDADTEKYKYPLSISWAVEYWLEHGARPDQILLGFASYGRGFKLSQQDCTTPLCPISGPCAMGSSTKEKGYLAYYEIQDMIKKGAVRHWDDDRKAPYIVTENGEWVGYDDEESYKYKMDFLKKQGLRGTIVWAIDLDDMTTYPLLNILKNALRQESTNEGLNLDEESCLDRYSSDICEAYKAYCAGGSSPYRGFESWMAANCCKTCRDNFGATTVQEKAFGNLEMSGPPPGFELALGTQSTSTNEVAIKVDNDRFWNKEKIIFLLVSVISVFIFIIGFVVLCSWKRNERQHASHFGLNQGILTFWTPEENEDPIVTI